MLCESQSCQARRHFPLWSLGSETEFILPDQQLFAVTSKTNSTVQLMAWKCDLSEEEYSARHSRFINKSVLNNITMCARNNSR